MKQTQKAASYCTPKAEVRMVETNIFTSETIQTVAYDGGNEYTWKNFFE